MVFGVIFANILVIPGVKKIAPQNNSAALLGNAASTSIIVGRIANVWMLEKSNIET
jgi:hypothetical protein